MTGTFYQRLPCQTRSGGRPIGSRAGSWRSTLGAFGPTGDAHAMAPTDEPTTALPPAKRTLISAATLCTLYKLERAVVAANPLTPLAQGR